MAQQLYCTIGSDNVSGGYQATLHLLQNGHRRIVFLGDTNLPEVHMRYQGYLDAHRELNITPPAELSVNVPFVPDKAKPIIEDLITGDKVFDAIFAASDLLAMTAIGCLMQHGRRVPEDVSVVGYDDIEVARHFHPALTTVRQPVDEAGSKLVGALLDLIAGNKAAPLHLVTQLIQRASVRSSASIPATESPQ